MVASKLMLKDPMLLDTQATQLITTTPSPPVRKLEELSLSAIVAENDRSSTPPEPKEQFGA